MFIKLFFFLGLDLEIGVKGIFLEKILTRHLNLYPGRIPVGPQIHHLDSLGIKLFRPAVIFDYLGFLGMACSQSHLGLFKKNSTYLGTVHIHLNKIGSALSEV